MHCGSSTNRLWAVSAPVFPRGLQMGRSALSKTAVMQQQQVGAELDCWK